MRTGTLAVSSVEEAIKAVDFPVELQEIRTITDLAIPDRRAVVRTDINKPLSVVGKDYMLIKHSDIIADKLEYLNKMGYVPTKLNVMREGRSIALEMVAENTTVMAGEDYKEKISVINSFDTTLSFKLVFGFLRLICTNGMIGFSNIVNRVTHSIGNKFKLRELEGIFTNRQNEIADTERILNRMSTLKVTYPELDYRKVLLASGFKEPEGLAKKYMEHFEQEINNEYSVRGLWNGITSYYTHNKQNEREIINNLTYTKRLFKGIKEVYTLN